MLDKRTVVLVYFRQLHTFVEVMKLYIKTATLNVSKNLISYSIFHNHASVQS